MVRILSSPFKKLFLNLLIISFITLWNKLNSKTTEKFKIIVREFHEGEKLFYVNSEKCKMPYVNPFNAEFMKINKPKIFMPCTNESDLITVNFDKVYNQYVLHINEEVLHKLSQSKSNEFSCFYQKIIYGQSAERYDKKGNRTKFTQDYLVPLDVEGMLVECRSADNILLLQKDAFTFVQNKKIPHSSQKDRKASVIMYGIDTVSRTNLRRMMPLLYEYLRSPGWYEMMGYNKVADNSFPNIFALLTGYSPETAETEICDTDLDGCLDKIPFIWQDFKKNGYLTAYAEDEEVSNTFSYKKPGFAVKPTDYYFRPFLNALEKETHVQYCPDCRKKYCLGRRLANSYIFDYCRQFMQRFVADRPIWGMFWTNHFSHDDVFMLSAMQHKILNDLLNFEKDGAFEHTIMIFFSDHGARFGPMMHMKESFLEERLPMMFIYLPPWFREKYPLYAEALFQNQNRLSSNFDVYNTLRHILNIDEGVDDTQWAFDCPQCQSLFHPLPENRGCSEAAIVEAYCTCHNYEVVKEEPWTWRMAELVVDRINQYLQLKNLNSLCSNLTLKFRSTEQRVDKIEEDESLPKRMQYYHTRIQVHQNMAEFYATVLYNRETEELKINVEHISRINIYGSDSECINNKITKLFCICSSKLQQSN
ncbi:LOW QUALITY PROTEIN: uncharacterized protein LOC108110424 [Drosophila eugracilis]|uniref:LOW QUALITY PROTEIN: uncharacterized protein LOC108110424 n=1 Tax=Drosophila eugracilis TaxID=29029 RepID=UPI001BDAD797|nr:LOW QUALITY PROTEIN: uncharacterized protein LOC108110424 [Drosophila eugracilis]